MAYGMNDLRTGLPDNLSGSVGNSLGGNLPSVPSMPTIPNVSGTPNFGAPAVPDGVDPCSSLEYLKNKLANMPLLGDLSLTDITGSINLDSLTLPEIPSLGEIADDIGKGISDGITGVINDVKDGVTGILEDLKPSNLIPNIKKEIGKAGRVALAGALEDAMLDALGPVKGGIADRIKRSVKTNLMVAGIEEVVNILEGKPNIFNPCPGKDKASKNAAAEASNAATGQMNIAMTNAISDQTKAAAAASNKMARDLIPPIPKPTLPLMTGLPGGVGSLPEIPGEAPEIHEANMQRHEAAVDIVADKATKQVAAQQSKKAAKNDEKTETRDERKSKGLPASGNNFKPVKKPGKTTQFYVVEQLKGVNFNSETQDIVGKLYDIITPSQEIISGKQSLEDLKAQQQKKLCTSNTDAVTDYFVSFRGEIYELNSSDYIGLGQIGVPEVFYSGWMELDLIQGGVQDINGDCVQGHFVLSRSDLRAREHANGLLNEQPEEANEFNDRYPYFLMNGLSWDNAQLIDQSIGKSRYNEALIDGVQDDVSLWAASYEDTVTNLFMIVTNPELIDIMFDIQHFKNKK